MAIHCWWAISINWNGKPQWFSCWLLLHSINWLVRSFIRLLTVVVVVFVEVFSWHLDIVLTILLEAREHIFITFNCNLSSIAFTQSLHTKYSFFVTKKTFQRSNSLFPLRGKWAWWSNSLISHRASAAAAVAATEMTTNFMFDFICAFHLCTFQFQSKYYCGEHTHSEREKEREGLSKSRCKAKAKNRCIAPTHRSYLYPSWRLSYKIFMCECVRVRGGGNCAQAKKKWLLYIFF